MSELNGRMEFFYEAQQGGTSIRVTLPADATLGEALESFEAFLLAAGYHFDGQIDIIASDDPELYDPKAEEN